MPSAIRMPLEVRQPDREGYSDTYEETRVRTSMTTGSDRVRQLFRSSPRLFSVRWTLTDAQYREFDRWFNDMVNGGAYEFDAKLIDANEVVTWFTCRWFPASYQAEIVQHNCWVVSGKLWSNTPGFVDRPAGTDELTGRQSVTIAAAGGLRIGVGLGGTCATALAAVGVLNKPFAAKAALNNVLSQGRIVLGVYGSGALTGAAEGRLVLGVAGEAALPAVAAGGALETT